MIGRTLNRYRILEQVGQGGMAVVYRGVDSSLERDVAVKVLHPHLAGRVEHRRRLAREARAVARLHHPNILEIYDFSGEDSPDAYLVTELIRGRTLRAFALEHPFDPPELAAACVYVLAGALGHAHGNGIVHRDLKPENVMIQELGPAPIVKLMDFGIAQVIDRDERMTVTGSLIGSPAHMAPEIIDGEEADVRSDVFSLGTILYWLATGSLPFEGASPGALLKRILLGEYADPRELRPGVSDSLARVVADALARNRSERIASAEEFRKRLLASLADSGVERPEEMLEQFLAHPAEAARDTRARVVAHLMRTGANAAREGRHARALACYARIVAVVPGTPEAGAAREAIDRLKTRVRRRKQLAWAAGIAALVALVSAATRLDLWPHRRAPEPAAETAPAVAAAPAPPEPAPPEPARVADAETGPAVRLQAVAPTVAPEPRSRPAHPRPGVRARPAAASGPAALGHYFITVKPYAHIAIDGQDAGETPREGELPAGDHVVRLTHDCCEPLEVKATIAEGRPWTFRDKLRPRPARLRLEVAGPADTQIMVDRDYKGPASQFAEAPLLVPLGTDANGEPRYDREVELRLFRTGFRDRTVPVRVRAGQETPVKVTMEPQG